jgi:hypothetical protein
VAVGAGVLVAVGGAVPVAAGDAVFVAVGDGRMVAVAEGDAVAVSAGVGVCVTLAGGGVDEAGITAVTVGAFSLSWAAKASPAARAGAGDGVAIGADPSAEPQPTISRIARNAPPIRQLDVVRRSRSTLPISDRSDRVATGWQSRLATRRH